jgi:endonuclease YncB( thermonuclease family)
MRTLLAILILLRVTQSWAFEAKITDGDTLTIGGVSFRLDGIDAPEMDQTCLDGNSAPWACGIEARNQLSAIVGANGVHCDDKGPQLDDSLRRAPQK